MIVPAQEAAWWGSALWLGGVALASFGVAWLSGRLSIRRAWYIPLLLLLTGGVSLGYLAWLDVDLGSVATHNWQWGVVAGVVAAALLYRPMQHQPVTRHVEGVQLRREIAWEGAVYGVAEGVLLTALPPYLGWQITQSLGWDGGGVEALGRWAVPILAAVAVVVIHHLGYWNYRNRMLVPIGLGLTVLTVAFLVTGSWIAPALGHVLMHVEATVHGTDLPPNPHGTTPARELVHA